MILGFGKGRARSQDGAFAMEPDAQGDKNGAIEHLSAVWDSFIMGVHEDMETVFQGWLRELSDWASGLAVYWLIRVESTECPQDSSTAAETLRVEMPGRKQVFPVIMWCRNS